MAHAEKCPICEGTGGWTPFNDGKTTAMPTRETCYGCGGRGWVEVLDAAREVYDRWQEQTA